MADELAPVKEESPAPEASKQALPEPKKIREMWEQGISQRKRIFDKEAWTNLAFLAGDQYSVYDETLQRFYRPNPGDQKTRLRVNLLKPIWRGEVGILTQAKPVPKVSPVTDEDTDSLVAQVGQKILDFEMDRLNFDLSRIELTSWSSSTGMCWWKVCWDPDEGQITLEVIPPFDIVADPSCKKDATKEARWVIHGQTISKEEAFELYGKDFKEDSGPTSNSWDALFNGGGMGSEGVLVLQLWHLPSRRYPAGFVRTIIGEDVVDDWDTYPYTHGMLPFIDTHHIRIPGRFQGQSTLVDLIPLQKDYNASRSRAADIRKLIASPKVLAPINSLDADRLTATDGEIIFYKNTGGYKPEFVTMQSPPSFLFDSADVAMREMEDISSRHDISKGSAPSGTSGAGILALQEKDERAVAVILTTFEQRVGLLGRHILELVKQHWTTPRKVKVWSYSGGDFAVQAFGAADLEGSFDVRVEPGSAIPRSREAKREETMNLWREGVVKDQMVILEMLDLPPDHSLVKRLSVDVTHAEKEHGYIFNGDDSLPEPWHNGEVHLKVHNDFRKTEIYRTWPDEVKTMFEDHILAHEVLMDIANGAEEDLPQEGDVPQEPPEELPPEMGMEGDMGMMPEELPPEMMDPAMMDPSMMGGMPMPPVGA